MPVNGVSLGISTTPTTSRGNRFCKGNDLKHPDEHATRTGTMKDVS